jgi:hypothetical protein
MKNNLLLLLLAIILLITACEKEKNISEKTDTTSFLNEEFELKIDEISSSLEASRLGKSTVRDGYSVASGNLVQTITNVETALNNNFGNPEFTYKDLRVAKGSIILPRSSNDLTEQQIQALYNTAYNLWYQTYTNYNVIDKIPLIIDLEKVDSLSSSTDTYVHIGVFVGEESETVNITPCDKTFKDKYFWTDPAVGDCNFQLGSAYAAINKELAKKPSPVSKCVYYTDIVLHIESSGVFTGLFSNDFLTPDYQKNKCISIDLMNPHYCQIISDFQSITPAGRVPIIRKIRSAYVLTEVDNTPSQRDYHAREIFIHGIKKIKPYCVDTEPAKPKKF